MLMDDEHELRILDAEVRIWRCEEKILRVMRWVAPASILVALAAIACSRYL